MKLFNYKPTKYFTYPDQRMRLTASGRSFAHFFLFWINDLLEP